MVFQTILESGNYALILRGLRLEEYAVVNGLNKNETDWAWTCGYWNFSEHSQTTEAEALLLAVDFFRLKTEENYIPRRRLDELATKSMHKLREYDDELAEEFFKEDCDLEDYERKWFGLGDEKSLEADENDWED